MGNRLQVNFNFFLYFKIFLQFLNVFARSMGYFCTFLVVFFFFLLKELCKHAYDIGVPLGSAVGSSGLEGALDPGMRVGTPGRPPRGFGALR